jgi:hypothetical protein
MTTTYADMVIDALGGTSAVARETEAPSSTVHSWRKMGITASRMAHLRLLAQVKGIELPDPTSDSGEVSPDSAPGDISDQAEAAE